MHSSTNTTSNGLPEDVYYFVQLTDTDQSGIVWTVAIISLIYCLTSSAVRFTLRRGMYGFDDAALLVSTAACVVQHGFVLNAAALGLGKAQFGTTTDKHDLANSTYIRIMMFFIVHSLAKVSLNLFIRRLFWGQDRLNSIFCNVLLGFNISWGLISILLMSVKCSPVWYFAQHNVCSHVIDRWLVIRLLDVFTELALVFVPILLLCRILINRKHKYIIIGTFAARLPVSVFAMMHFFELRNSLHTTKERGLALVWPVVWLQFELLWSMVTASLPSFKPLVTPFNTIVDDSGQQPSDPILSGASIMMGHDQPIKQMRAMETWASGSAGQTQLTNVDTMMTSSSLRANKKGISTTTIHGPKRRFPGMESKGRDIEMGQIHHEVEFEISFEQAKRESRWSRITQKSKESDAGELSGDKEGEPAPKKDET